MRATCLVGLCNSNGRRLSSSGSLEAESQETSKSCALLLLLTAELRVSHFCLSVGKTVVAGGAWELGSKHVFLVGVIYFIKLTLG